MFYFTSVVWDWEKKLWFVCFCFLRNNKVGESSEDIISSDGLVQRNDAIEDGEGIPLVEVGKYSVYLSLLRNEEGREELKFEGESDRERSNGSQVNPEAFVKNLDMKGIWRSCSGGVSSSVIKGGVIDSSLGCSSSLVPTCIEEGDELIFAVVVVLACSKFVLICKSFIINGMGRR